MAWLADHAKALTAIAAALLIVLGGTRWVAGAEEAHRQTRTQAEIIDRLAEIVDHQQKQDEKDEALEKQRKRIRKCLRENPDDEDTCFVD
jgi:hypothetical protein